MAVIAALRAASSATSSETTMPFHATGESRSANDPSSTAPSTLINTLATLIDSASAVVLRIQGDGTIHRPAPALIPLDTRTARTASHRW